MKHIGANEETTTTNTQGDGGQQRPRRTENSAIDAFHLHARMFWRSKSIIADGGAVHESRVGVGRRDY